MRQAKRIPIVLEVFRSNPATLSKFLYNDKLTKSPELTKEFEEFWLEEPDLRLGQALINRELIPDGDAWFKEEIDWLMDHEYLNPEDIFFWGVNYDEEGERLPETDYRLLRDLSTDHIEAILKWVDVRNQILPDEYLSYFMKRVKNKKQ